MGLEYGLFNRTKNEWLHLGKQLTKPIIRFQMDGDKISSFLANNPYDDFIILDEHKWPDYIEADDLEIQGFKCVGRWHS